MSCYSLLSCMAHWRHSLFPSSALSSIPLSLLSAWVLQSGWLAFVFTGAGARVTFQQGLLQTFGTRDHYCLNKGGEWTDREVLNVCSAPPHCKSLHLSCFCFFSHCFPFWTLFFAFTSLALSSVTARTCLNELLVCLVYSLNIPRGIKH